MNTDSFKKAEECFAVLIGDSELSARVSPELYKSFTTDSEVREALNMIATVHECSILDVVQSRKIYLIPNQDNTTFSYNFTSFKEKLLKGNATNKDVYMVDAIMTLIFSAFYGGKNKRAKQLHFLSFAGAIEKIDAWCISCLNCDDEEEQQININFKEFAQEWMNRISDDQTHRPKTKINTLKRIISILRDQKLFYIMKETDTFRPTSRLDDLMEYWFLNTNRFNEVNAYIEKISVRDQEGA